MINWIVKWIDGHVNTVGFRRKLTILGKLKCDQIGIIFDCQEAYLYILHSISTRFTATHCHPQASDHTHKIITEYFLSKQPNDHTELCNKLGKNTLQEIVL